MCYAIDAGGFADEFAGGFAGGFGGFAGVLVLAE